MCAMMQKLRICAGSVRAGVGGTFHGVTAIRLRPGSTANLLSAVLTGLRFRPPPEIRRGSSRVANIKSQIKRNRQNEAARLRNKAVKSELKTAVRRFRETAEGGDAEATTSALRSASRLLDKAVSKGVIHKNQAANRKAAMANRANAK